MPRRIKDYAIVGDLQTAALVGADHSVDWLCFPCFAALLGEDTNGRWRIAPTSGGRCTRRRYRGHTLVLETEWDTPSGAVRVVDCMPPRGVAPDLVRVVEGIRGKVSVTSELRICFDYGHIAPWVTVSVWRVPSIAGGPCTTRSTPTSWRMATTPSGGPSPRLTAPGRWTRARCSSHAWGFALRRRAGGQYRGDDP